MLERTMSAPFLNSDPKKEMTITLIKEYIYGYTMTDRNQYTEIPEPCEGCDGWLNCDYENCETWLNWVADEVLISFLSVSRVA